MNLKAEVKFSAYYEAKIAVDLRSAKLIFKYLHHKTIRPLIRFGLHHKFLG